MLVPGFRRLRIDAESLHELGEEGASYVCDSIQRGWLEFLEARMVHDLAYASSEGGTTRLSSHYGPRIRHDMRLDVRLQQGLGIVLLKLVLIHL